MEQWFSTVYSLRSNKKRIKHSMASLVVLLFNFYMSRGLKNEMLLTCREKLKFSVAGVDLSIFSISNEIMRSLKKNNMILQTKKWCVFVDLKINFDAINN